MSAKSSAIQFDFEKDTLSDTGVVDGLGMTLMRLAAKATRPDYTGLSIANRLIRTVLPSQRFVRANLFPDSSFEFPYGDGYWGCLLDNSKVYSPDVEDILLKLVEVDYAFIDCGANYGYMSVIISGEAYGSKPCIAIEADPDTYRFLERNHALNGNRFEIMNRAVFSKSGEMVNIHGEKHEARSILDESGTRQSGNVETLAIDDLTDWLQSHSNLPVVLKLDVEGVEIEAMKGAAGLLEKDLLVVFEDHASDPNHEVTRYFMDDLDMKIFVASEGYLKEVRTSDDLDEVKKNHRVGYDFFATKSSFWRYALLKYAIRED